jgi:hypothetical protein
MVRHVAEMIGQAQGTRREDARRDILALPKSEHETTAWEVAIEALLVAADSKSDSQKG